MSTSNDFFDSAHSESNIESAYPPILLAGDNVRLADAIGRSLQAEGFPVQLASGYRNISEIWQQHRHPVVLLDVSNVHAVEEAVAAAITIKRHDPAQFVGYLADPILRTSGLAGDAIFPRNLRSLPDALRRHFDWL